METKDVYADVVAHQDDDGDGEMGDDADDDDGLNVAQVRRVAPF